MPFYYRTLHLDRNDFVPGHNRGIPGAENPQTIGEHLRLGRCQLRLTQFQIARRLQVSTVTFSRRERDHTYPTWDYHARIIEYLGDDAFEQTGLKDPYGNEPHGVAFFADDTSEEIGQQIRQKRVELKPTVNKFAKKFEVSERTLRDWEKGRHRPLKCPAERVKRLLRAEAPDFDKVE